MKTFDAAAWAVAVSLILFFAVALPAFAQVAPPSRGGTGTSTLPTLGQLLMGQANGTYGPQSTSTLGLLTTNVAEGTNQYFTDARARAAVATGYATAAIPYANGTNFSVDATKLVWDSPTARLGVNVASPTATLTVGGDISLTNGANRRVSIGSATSYFYDLQTTGDDFQIIEAGSTPRLHIEYPNGYVGIGTTTPAGQLDVATGLNGYAFIGGNTPLAHRGVKIGQNSDGYSVIQGFARGSANAFDLTLQPEGGNVGIGATTPNSALHISRALPIIHYDRSGSYSWYQGQTDGSGYSGGTSDFGIWDNSGTNRFIISASTGNVGIGNTTPSYRLTVVDLETDGIAGRFAQSGAGTPFGVYSTATGAGTTNTSGYFQASGATTNIGVSADVASGSNNYAFYAGNTAKSYFAGNVGIGDTSPTQNLTVAGNGSLTGYLRVGSETAPNNTTAGDLTATRLSVGNGTLSGNLTEIALFTGTLPATSGTSIAVQIAPSIAPAANSSAGYRALAMTNQVAAGSSNLTAGAGSSAAGFFGNTINNAGTITALGGIASTGGGFGSGSSAVGTITEISGGYFRGVSSSGNSLTTTITRTGGVRIFDSINAGSGPLTLTGQYGLMVDALDEATNNSAILIGQSTVPTGNFGIYSATPNSSYFAGHVGIGITNPGAPLHLFSAATTTLTVDSSAADKGSCLKLKDRDGSGFTYVTANDGVLTASSISCE